MLRNATLGVTLLVALMLFGATRSDAVTQYAFGRSTGTYTAITGTQLFGPNTVNNFTSVSLPFNFTFSGTTYNTMYVTTHGTIEFGSVYNNYDPLSGNTPVAISAFGRVLFTGPNGNVSWTTTGTSPNRVVTVQWTDMKRNEYGAESFNFQIKLYETSNRIDLVYGTMVALQNSGMEMGLINTSMNPSTYCVVADYDMNTWATASWRSGYQPSMIEANFAPASGQTYTFYYRTNWTPDASVVGLTNPSSKFNAGTSQNIKVKVKNWGTTNLDSVTIEWKVNGVSQPAVKYYPNPVMTPNEEREVSLGFYTFAAKSFNTIWARTIKPNNLTDANASNDEFWAYVAPRVSGNLDVAQAGNPGVFNTFRDLTRHLNVSGVNGTVNVTVRGGEYYEQVYFPYIEGSNQNSINLKRYADDHVMIAQPQAYWVSGNDVSEEYPGAFILDHVQNMSFEGLHVMVQQNTDDWNACFHMNGVTNVTVNDCEFGPWGARNNMDDSYGIDGDWDWNTNVTVRNSEFSGVAWGFGIGSWGSLLENNTFVDVETWGFWAYGSNAVIRGNYIEMDDASWLSSYSQYGFQWWGNNGLIERNTVKISNVPSGSAGMELGTYNYQNPGSVSVNTVRNNMFDMGSTSWSRGLAVYSYNNYPSNLTIHHNTVNVHSSNTQNNTAAYYRYADQGSHTTSLINNIFNNIGTGTATGGYAIYEYGYTSTPLNNTLTVSDFNDLFTNGPNMGYFYNWSTGITNLVPRSTVGSPLTAWRNATQRDYNSVSVNPVFRGAGDVHLLNIDTRLWGTSALLSSIPTDVDGETRVKPYMGADEIAPQIEITQQPQSAYACVGENINFITIASVTEGATTTYQWYKDGAELVGKTSALLSITNVGYNAAGVYRCKVTATDNSTTIEEWSDEATLIVVRPTQITVQPVSQPVALGGDVTLEVSAEAIGAPQDFEAAYQWKKRFYVGNGIYNDTNIVDNGRITGSQSTKLTIRNVGAIDTADFYVCEVTGYCGTAMTKTARLFVPTVIIVNITPFICADGTMQLECATSPGGGAGLTVDYQWYYNGSPMSDNAQVSGATSKVLTVAQYTASNNGGYQCRVTYQPSNVTIGSNILQVDLIYPPVITANPSSDTLCERENLMLTVGATGTDLNYQWSKDGADIPGATNDTLYVADVTVANAGVYKVTVSNPCGVVTSEEATVVIKQFPAIIEQPEDAEVYDGDPIVFTVVAGGSEPIYYQWYHNGDPINGGTEATYTIPSGWVTDTGYYYVAIKNECGEIISDTVYVRMTVGVTGEWTENGYGLGMAMPNPTSSTSTFSYTLPTSSQVRITLTDVLGRTLSTLVNDVVAPGTHSVTIDPLTIGLIPGVYTYTIETNGFTASNQVVIVK